MKEELDEFKLAELYQDNRQYQEASELLHNMLAREAESRRQQKILVWLAEFRLEQDDFQSALDYWKRARALEEHRVPDAWIEELQARILLCQYAALPATEKDEALLDQAMTVLQQAVTPGADPELLAWLYLDLGKVYQERYMPNEATDCLNKALAQGPKDKNLLAECHMELGLIELWRYENPGSAVETLKTAIQVSPLQPPSNWLSFCYDTLAWTFIMLGNLKEALKAGKTGLEVIDSREHDYSAALFQSHYTLGAVYDRMESKNLAIEHYQAALAAKDDPDTYDHLGKLYFAKQEPEQALKMFELALAVDPNYEGKGDVYNRIGLCFAEMKRYQDALAFFEKAQEEQATISFKPAELYNNIGVAHWHLNQFDEAAEAFKTALGLMRPKDKEYRKVERYLRYVQAEISLGDRMR